MRRVCFLIIVLALIAPAIPGCAPKVSIPSWQRSVNAYVNQTGRGDPNVLRDVTLPNTDRRGFAVLAHHNPDESIDANGLLLAHRDVAGRPWFVYLVGLVKKQKVGEIRLAALSDTAGKPVWRLGPRNKDAERAYREYNLKQFRARFPARKKPPPEYLGFPRESDTFDLSVDDAGRLTATHPPSGARWELDVSPQKR